MNQSWVNEWQLIKGASLEFDYYKRKKTGINHHFHLTKDLNYEYHI